MDEAVLHTARAAILADLRSRGLEDVMTVSALEEAMSQRRWWVEQWPDGLPYVAGLVAQDVQDALFGRRAPVAGVPPLPGSGAGAHAGDRAGPRRAPTRCGSARRPAHEVCPLGALG